MTPTRRHLLTAAAAWPASGPLRLAQAVAAVTGAGLAGCASAPASAPAAASAEEVARAGQAFRQWSEGFAADWVRQFPEYSTVLRYFPAEEQARLDGMSSPLTEAARVERLALAARGLRELQPHLAAPLSAADRAGALTLRWSLQRALDGAPFEDHGFLFAQTFGLQVRYQSTFAEVQPLRRAADWPAWRARLAAVPQRLDEAIASQRRSAARGIVPPNFILERARDQVRQLVEPPLAQDVVLSALQRRLQNVADLDAAARQRAEAEAAALIEQQVRPAWRRVLQLFDELLPRATADAGLWRLPRGAEAYAQALAANTTTRLTPDEVHELGLREVARIEQEMDRLLRQMGRTSGSVNARMEALQAEHSPPVEPDPRPALLARYGEMVRDAERRAAALFNLKPRAPVEVRRVAPLVERTASAYYTTPAPDGSRPGVFWVPMPGPRFNVLGMRALAVHEAVPGHHFQLALQQETASLPRWRQMRVFGGGSAHAEGWALYAERLAIDHGWYEGDPLSLLGAWDAQLFRARRLVVDTGLHARRWTREQAIAYGINAREVERYVVNPGQACAYMVGMLRILQLRERAQAKLGGAFDLKRFHDLVLTTGSVPLDVLEQAVDGWLAQGGPGVVRAAAGPAAIPAGPATVQPDGRAAASARG